MICGLLKQAGRARNITVYQIKADVLLFEGWDGGPSLLKKKIVETESALKCVDLGNVDSRHIDLVTMLWDKLDKQRMWARINNGHKSLLYLLVNEINLRINQRLNAYRRYYVQIHSYTCLGRTLGQMLGVWRGCHMSIANSISQATQCLQTSRLIKRLKMWTAGLYCNTISTPKGTCGSVSFFSFFYISVLLSYNWHKIVRCA